MPRLKRNILAGLSLACILLLLLVLLGRPEPRVPPADVQTIDATVLEILGEWQIREPAVSYKEYASDSLFVRREAAVVIHPSLPSTLIHARIARRLSPLGVDILGQRYFPENMLRLDFIIYDTLVYSLLLEISAAEEDEETEAVTPDIVTD